MIARIWHGIVPSAKSDEYLEYVKETGLNDYFKTEGNRGAFIFRRTDGDQTHFMTLSFWESFEAIKRFAGEEYEKAVYYPEDEKYLLEFEPHVLHYEVFGSSLPVE